MSERFPLPTDRAEFRDRRPKTGIPSSTRRAVGAVALFILTFSSCPVVRSQNPTVSALPGGTAEAESPSFGDAAPETAEALKMAGFEQAFAYTWKGGRLGGFVQFDGSKRLDIDSLVGETLSKLNRIADAEGSPVDPSRTRGFVLFAVSPPERPATVRKCLFGLRIATETRDGKHAQSYTLTERGTIPDFGSCGSGTGSFLVNLPDGRRLQIFQFRLVPAKLAGPTNRQEK